LSAPLRIALVASGQTGNTGPNGYIESNWAYQVTPYALREIERQGHEGLALCYPDRDSSGPLGGIYRAAREANDWLATHVIGIHSNANAGYALGILGVLYSERRDPWGHALCRRLSELVGLPYRTAAPACILEVCAHDTLEGVQWLMGHIEATGTAIAQAAIVAAGRELRPPTPPTPPLAGDWTEDAEWCREAGLMLGYADGSFGAADPVTRGQLATVLRRLAT